MLYFIIFNNYLLRIEEVDFFYHQILQLRQLGVQFKQLRPSF